MASILDIQGFFACLSPPVFSFFLNQIVVSATANIVAANTATFLFLKNLPYTITTHQTNCMSFICLTYKDKTNEIPIDLVIHGHIRVFTFTNYVVITL